MQSCKQKYRVLLFYYLCQWGYIIIVVCPSVCLPVCLAVCLVTQTAMNGFSSNFQSVHICLSKK